MNVDILENSEPQRSFLPEQNEHDNRINDSEKPDDNENNNGTEQLYYHVFYCNALTGIIREAINVAAFSDEDLINKINLRCAPELRAAPAGRPICVDGTWFAEGKDTFLWRRQGGVQALREAVSTNLSRK